jgi:hypothetical protein
VPTEHLETLDERFKASIQKIAAEPLDMNRMATIIERDRLKVRLFLGLAYLSLVYELDSFEVPLKIKGAIYSLIRSLMTLSMAMRTEKTCLAPLKSITRH